MIPEAATMGMGVLAVAFFVAGALLAIRERRRESLADANVEAGNGTGFGDVSAIDRSSLKANRFHLKASKEDAAGESRAIANRLDGWIERMLLQSGLNGSATRLVASGGLVGVVSAIGFYVLTENMIAGSALCVSASVAPLGYVVFVRQRRLARAENQLPGALELLAGAMRSGLSLEQGLKNVSNSIEVPLAEDFRLLASQLELGRSIRGATEAINLRTPLPDIQLFSVTLNTHRSAGGNLVHSLGLLASVARDRLQFRQSVRSKMAAGKLSAIGTAMGAPFTLLYFLLLAPEYAALLLENSTGQIVLCVSGGLWVTGLIWVWKLSKTS